ncbi:MAG: hypothetical protein ABS938_13955, partial [Psychrobacillus psychrodurans]
PKIIFLVFTNQIRKQNNKNRISEPPTTLIQFHTIGKYFTKVYQNEYGLRKLQLVPPTIES